MSSIADENDNSKAQDAEAGALRGSLRYLTRYLVQSSFFINRIAAIHPIQYLNALKLHRSIKKAKATTNEKRLQPSIQSTHTPQTPTSSIQTKLKNALFLTKKYTIIFVTALPGFIKSYYVGLVLFRTYGKNATAHNNILTKSDDDNAGVNATSTQSATIEYNKKKYLLIYHPQNNFYEVKQGFINGAIAGSAFASFFIGWDIMISKSALLYSAITLSLTNTSNTKTAKNIPIFNQYIQFYSSHFRQLSTALSPSHLYTQIISKPLSFSVTGSFPVHVAVYSVFFGSYEFLKPIYYRSLRALLISSNSSNSGSRINRSSGSSSNNISNNNISQNDIIDNSKNNTNNSNNSSSTDNNENTDSQQQQHHFDSITHHGQDPNNNNPNHNSNSRISFSEPTPTLWHRFLLGNVRFWSISMAGATAGMLSEIVNYYGEYLILNGFTTQSKQIQIQQHLQQHADAVLSKTNLQPLSAASNTTMTISSLANLATEATAAVNVSTNTTTVDNSTTTSAAATTNKNHISTAINSSSLTSSSNNNNTNKSIIRQIYTHIRNKPFPRISSLFAVGFPSAIGFVAYEHGKQAILL